MEEDDQPKKTFNGELEELRSACTELVRSIVQAIADNKQQVMMIMVVVIFIPFFYSGISCMRKSIADTQVESERRYQSRQRAAYTGWKKLRGNPKDLTFDEWKALRDYGILKEE